MKAWLYGLAVLFSVVLLIGCEGAGAGGGDDGTGDGTDDGSTEPLPGATIGISGTVDRQIDPNTFTDIAFTNPSDAVIFFLIDSGFTFSIIDQDTPATRNYDFDLTIPVPEADDLQDIPTGVTSSDLEAKIINIDLYGAREDGIVYEASDVLALGTITGTAGPDETVTAELVRYVYADRQTTLNGTDADSGIVIDNMELSPGWNLVIQTTEITYDNDGVLSGFSNTLANGPVPSGSEWLLITNFLQGQVESTNNANGTAAYLAYDSSDPGQSEVYIRATVSDMESFSIEGFSDISSREVLIYFGLDDSNNADSVLDDEDGANYTLGGDDQTNMIDVFILVYSETTSEQITAGTGPASNTTQIDGSPLGNYLEITDGNLYYQDGAGEGHTFEFSITTTDGKTIEGDYYPSELSTFDYAVYPF